MVATTAEDVATQPRPARLPYWPALDGLRGVAMAAILFFHGTIGWAKGGFLCVSIFFTLSGFLITSLVLSERQSSGTVKLSAFWARRARRLVPASIVALLLAAVVTAIAVPAAQQSSVAGDIRASLLQVANWRFIAEGAVYADLNVVPSPVQHYWSLAIEEQFYITFPIVALLALRRSRATLGVVFVALIAFSLSRQITLDGVDRIYFGTDTRAAEVAVGGLLAIGYPSLRKLPALRRWPVADVGGFIGLAAATVIFLTITHQTGVLYHGGLAAFAIVSAAMVFACVEGPAFRRVLSFRPFVELGKISYGVYLYHFPFFVWLSEDRMGFGGMWLLIVRVIPTLTMAILSAWLIELPIRRGVALKGRLAPAALGGAFVAVLLVAVPVGRLGDDDLTLAFEPVAPPSSTSTPDTTAPTSSSSTEPGQGGQPVGSPSSTTTIEPARPPRVVVVGDSTARANGQGLEQWGEDTGRMQVVWLSEPGCGPLVGIRFTIREGYTFEPQRCDQLFPRAASTARELDADAIVVFIGSSQLADWEYADLEGEHHHLGEPLIDERYATAVDLAIDQLESARVPILWATVPLPEWDLEVFSQMIGGTPIPGEGPITLNDPPRTVRLNQLNDAAVPQSSLAALWPYAERLRGPDGTIPTRVRPDGLHLGPDGVQEVADAWMFDVLGEAFRQVAARDEVALDPIERHSWSAPGAPLRASD